MNQAKSDKYSQGTLGFFINFFAGGLSGVIAKTATAPIERIKLILQTQLSNDRVIRPYKGIVDCFYRTVTEEGALALWRGNMANVIRYFPTQALNFAFKDVYRDMFVPKKKDPSNYTKIVVGNIMAGGFAGSTSTLFVYPLDLARTRLGVDMGASPHERQFKGVADCLSKIYKTDGFKGLYRGIGVSLFGIFCYRGLYFGSFDSGKGLLFNYDDASIFQKFFFAQACVIFSESISYPTDTVKRRLMMQSAKKEIKYTGGLDCIQKIFREEGLKGFWKGNLTNIFRSVGSSLCLVLYDEMKKRTDKYALAY